MTSAEQKEHLLRRVPSALNPPPMMVQPGVHKLDTPVTLPPNVDFPPATCTQSRLDAQKRRFPQCIAHRGYKAAYPENTMASFKGAVKVGTHALETDVHITKDEVVVLSHDPSLKRCYGRPEKILDCTWDEIKDARTIAKPHEPMPRLKDLLEYLAQPGLEEIWLLLDIKLSNDADSIMRLMASTIAAVPPSPGKEWKERIVLGIWAAKYLPLAIKYLPDFPVSNIAFSTQYARHFFTVPNVSFNMLFPVLVAPGGKSFIRDAKEKYQRPIYTWTVNDRDKMEWCIRRKLDGVVTDDPQKYLEVCEKFGDEQKEALAPLRMRTYWDVMRVWLWVAFVGFWYKKMFMPVASQALIRREGKRSNCPSDIVLRDETADCRHCVLHRP